MEQQQVARPHSPRSTESPSRQALPLDDGTHPLSVSVDSIRKPAETGRFARIPSLRSRDSQAREHKILRKPLPASTTTPTPAPAPKAPATQERRDHGLFHVWWWEIGACSLAVAALVAIIATLHSYRGQSLPQLPFGISVNALISIYAVVMKGSLITVVATGIGQLKWTWFESDRPLDDLVAFDQASRGVPGSLYLLWHVHFRQAVASLGALLLVLMLAVDPFTQQLVHYVGCSEVLTNQIAAVPRTNFFQEKGYHLGAYSSSINTGVQSAVNSGIFAPGGLVDVICPTGNCTFTREYGTVGFCSYCKDISHLILVNTTCYNSSEPPKAMKCSNETARNLTSYVPNGISMTFADLAGGAPDVASMESIGYDGGDIPSGVQMIVGKSDFTDFKIDPATGESLKGCDNPATNDTWRCRNYGAVACGLSHCVRTYNASVTAGVFHEEQTDQSPYDMEWGYDDEYYAHAGTVTQGLVDLRCVSNDEHQGLLESGYQINHDQRWLPYNITFDPRQRLSNDSSEKYPQSLLAHNCLYLMDDLFMASLWSNYLAYFFNGTIQGLFGYGYTSGLTMLEGPQVLQTMYNYGHISFERINNIFQNISDGMTNHIRQNGNANQSAPVEGQVLHYATCLDVKWGWIAFPASMVTVTVIFCVLIITTTAVHNSEIWKSSPLAMIYHGPYTKNDAGRGIVPKAVEKGNSQADEPRRIRSMEAAARSLIVRLDKHEGRMKISESQVKMNGREGKSSQPKG